jgi:hypothetical protein
VSFAGTDKHFGYNGRHRKSRTVDAGRSRCNMTVLVRGLATPNYAYEVRPVEDDADAYCIDDIKVCNSHPTYSSRPQSRSTSSIIGRAGPSRPAAGGYISTFDMNGTFGWHQISGWLQPADRPRAGAWTSPAAANAGDARPWRLDRPQ